MIEQSMDGLLFFRGGREARACVAYDVTQIGARMYSDELGLLPIDFSSRSTTFERSADANSPGGVETISGSSSKNGVDVRAHVPDSDSDAA